MLEQHRGSAGCLCCNGSVGDQEPSVSGAVGISPQRASLRYIICPVGLGWWVSTLVLMGLGTGSVTVLWPGGDSETAKGNWTHLERSSQYRPQWGTGTDRSAAEQS